MAHAFVSYSRADRDYVTQLAAYLQTNGTSVWYDADLETGQRFERVIRERIDTCGAVVVVMTPEAEQSEWVGLEIARAKQQAKPILPILLRGEPMFALGTLSSTDVVGGFMPPTAFVEQLASLLSPGEVQPGVHLQAPSGVFDQLARNRPPRSRSVSVTVARHAASDIVHEMLIAAVLTEMVFAWPEGSTFVFNYGAAGYAQGAFYGHSLLTEIGPMRDDRLAEAVRLGWFDPSGQHRNDERYRSRDLWRDNPVREWTVDREPLANVAAFLARGVERVLRFDPSTGYGIEIFNNLSDDEAPTRFIPGPMDL